MKPALPHKSVGGSVHPPPGNCNNGDYAVDHDSRSMRDLVEENAVVIFARNGCCMCHVVKHLLQGQGVNPTIFDVDEQNEADVSREFPEFPAIQDAGGAILQLPTVFIGGELLGGMDEIMEAHISGELVPMLREAGALWL